MKNRPQSGERPPQIVAAALEVLEDTPLESVSTRKIARRLGISQPALFRHFRSRDELMLAVVDSTRAQLGAVAAGIIDGRQSPAAQLRALAVGLLEHVEQNPGLPRLLFSLPEQGNVAMALRQLIAMQTSLVTEVFRHGQHQGEFDAAIDPEQAGRMFVALIQGLVLQWQTSGCHGRLVNDSESLMALWLDGVRATGAPPASTALASTALASTAPAEAGEEGIVELDVRPILAAGDDPLNEILAAVAAAGRRGIVVVTAPFRPEPLLALLGTQGHTVVDRQLDGKTWSIEIFVDGPEIEDLRELEVPEPLERVLEATASLAPEEVYIARLPRFPRLLINHLEDRGLRWAIHDGADGSALLRVKGPR